MFPRVTRLSCHRATAFPCILRHLPSPRLTEHGSCVQFFTPPPIRPRVNHDDGGAVILFRPFFRSKNVYCSERETRDVPPGKPFQFPESSDRRPGDRLENRVPGSTLSAVFVSRINMMMIFILFLSLCAPFSYTANRRCT